MAEWRQDRRDAQHGAGIVLRGSQLTRERTSTKGDHFSLTYAEYAYKAGAWRLLDLMDEFKIKGSVSTNGLTGERHPKVVREFADYGCEIVAHGWAQDVLSRDDDPETEIAEMRKVTQVLTQAAGRRPLGWVSQGSAGSGNTLDFLKGEGYLWSGDDMSDDLPFLKQTKHGPIVILPRVNLPHNDLWMWATARTTTCCKAGRQRLTSLCGGVGRRAEMVRAHAARPHGRETNDDSGGAPDADLCAQAQRRLVHATRRYRRMDDGTRGAQRSNLMRTLLKLLTAALVFAPTIVSAEPVKLKFAVFSPDSERLYNTVKKPFAAAVNADSGGAIEIELYPNGALGRAPQQQAQMVLDGVSDIGFIVPPFTPGRFPDSEVLELPGIFQNLAEGTQVYTNLVKSGVLRDYGDFVPIAMWATPPFSLHSNFPLASVKDVKGKKVRGSGVIQIESLKALGAVPVGMPPTEVPEAMARRTIDATTSQPAVLFDFGLDRVTSHHYFIRLGAVPLAVVMNRKKFETLPKSGQDAILSHSLDWINKLYDDSMLEYDQSLIDRLKSDPNRTVVFPDAADQAAARVAFEPVIQAWIAKRPQNAELYKAATGEIEKIRAKK